MARKRPRVEPTDDLQEILPLCWWPEQVEYERIRQPVLFGTSVTERAEQTGVSRRTLQRRIARFGEEGMEGLFQTEAAKKQKLPPNIRASGCAARRDAGSVHALKSGTRPKTQRISGGYQPGAVVPCTP